MNAFAYATDSHAFIRIHVVFADVHKAAQIYSVNEPVYADLYAHA
jgi:hypothetical protein